VTAAVPGTVPAALAAALIAALDLQAAEIAKEALLAVVFSAGSMQLPLDWAFVRFENVPQQRSKFPQSQTE
jgi:hypothetical protein